MNQPTPEQFRVDVVRFLDESSDSGIACPAFGAILPPALHDRSRAWQAHMAAEGFAGIHWPVEYGGRGLSRRHTSIWFEECARHAVSPYLNLQGIILSAEALLRSGSDEQKQRFLPGTLTGATLWCQLFSEPDAGSDLAGLQAAAVADGDRFVVNGQKVWSSNAQFAEAGILMARTGPGKHKGISFFCIDMDLPGVEVRTIKQITGDEEFCEVFFDDVVLPADSLVGPLNGGWGVAMSVLQDERGSFGGAGVISFDRQLDSIAALATATDDEHIRRRLASLLVGGGALRSLMLRSDADPSVAGASAAKLMRTELGNEAAGLALDLLGAGAMIDNDATEGFLYAPGMRIAGGSSEIQRNIIGERVLGLPREPG